MDPLLSRRNFVWGVAGAAMAGGFPGAMGAAEKSLQIQPFHITASSGVLSDLRYRLEHTRWNDAVTADWSYGTARPFLQHLIGYWRDVYDWRVREAAFNALPQFHVTIDGFGVQFLHYKGRGPSPTPLLLMNGWPSSFVEYQKLAPMLSNPGQFGGDPADAFDVVIPAMPGFGFSERPTRPLQARAVDLNLKLMTDFLGYKRFMASGTDIGAGVATRLGLEHPDLLLGIHIASVADPPLDSTSPPLTEAEKAFRRREETWEQQEGAYSAIQSTRPQTLAFGLADSPVGLASWITEKFYAWSDCHGDVLSVFPLEMLIDNLMIYWLTETIGSSVRYYYEATRWRRPFRPGDHVPVPTAVMMMPKDLVVAPREWAERFYNVRRYTLMDRGGHFPAWEAPDLYAGDLRSFARTL